MSASSAPHHGPAMTRERSSTRIPSSANGPSDMPLKIANLGDPDHLEIHAPPRSMSESGDRRLRYYGFVTALRDALAERILVLDGAMGTMIQAHALGPDDFGGAEH